MTKYIEIDRAIETALLLLEEGEDEQTLAYNAALVAFVKNMENQPAADVVPVVRCADCKYGDTGTDEDGRRFYKCIGIHYGGVSPTDYCSYGERKDG